MPSNHHAWRTPSTTFATGSIIASSMALGAAALFIRPLTDAGIAPAALAFFRFAATAMVLSRALDLSDEGRSATLWGMIGGAAAGGGWIAYADAVERVDLATTGVAYMTYPIFALAAGRILFARRAESRSIIGGLLVCLAAAVALGPATLPSISLSLFIAPASFGFSIAVLTERLGVLDPSARLAAVAFGATAALSPVVLALPIGEVVPASLPHLALAAGIAFGCGLIPMWIYSAAAPIIGSAKTSVAGASELLTMFAVGAAVFGEAIQPGHVVALVLISASIALTPSRVQHLAATASTKTWRTGEADPVYQYSS